MNSDEFGCNHCWPEAAEQAWSNFQTLTISHNLIDESHHIIKLHECQQCGQPFVSIFCEQIDWINGEDPQYRQIMPLTIEETNLLKTAPPDQLLYELGRERASLRRDFPKDATGPTTFWSTGLQRMPHD